jgi:arylformamidase
MNRIIDISVRLEEGMPVWPGSAGFRRFETHRIAGGDDANVSRLECDVHVGTHVDAPAHFVDGAATVEQLPLEVLIGPAEVVHVPDRDAIDEETVMGAVPAGCARVLFRTQNSDAWRPGPRPFEPDFVALTAPAAHALVARGVRLVGVDYLSVQRFRDGPETHQALLGAGVVVVEGLCLAGVVPGPYELTCLPLKLVGADGAPARAVLRTLPVGGGE